jgi:hypothetical protein
MAFGTESHSTGTGTSVAISTPASTASGETLLYAISADGNGATVTFPTGFAHVTGSPETLGSPDGHRLHVGWKVADGTEGGTLTATISASLGWSGCILRYTGRHATAPIDVSPGINKNGTGNASPVAPASATITTVTNGCDLVWIAILDPTSATPGAASTPPSGYTERVDTTGTNGTTITAADINQGTAGATGAVTGSISFSAGTAGWIAFLVPLAPSAGGGGGRILRPGSGIGTGGTQNLSGGVRCASRSRIVVPPNYRTRLPLRTPELRA